MKLKQMIAVLSSVAMLLCGCSSANAKDQTYSDTLYDTVGKGPDSGSFKQECHERIKKSLSKIQYHVFYVCRRQ